MENELKRRSEGDDNEQPLKRHKPMKPEANDREDEEVPVKLDDLHDYCLEDIFKYLELSDLLSLAGTSDRFVGEAKQAARRKFHKKPVEISGKTISIENEKQISLRSFPVYKLQTFLDVFGADISTLTINYDGDNDEQHLIHYFQLLEILIINHCSSTLIGLKLVNLGFEHEIFVHTNKRFEALQHLEIGGYLDDYYPAIFEIDDIKAFIRMNPQIRTLNVKADGCLTQEFWQFIDEHLPHLEYIELAGFIEDFQWAVIKYTKKNQKLVAYHVPHLSITCLKELEFEREEFIDDLLEFVCKNRNLMKLNMDSWDDDIFEDEDITMLIRSLKKLEELSLYSEDITINGFIRLLTECKSLQILRLRFPYEDEALYEPFMNARIGFNWKVIKEMDESLKFIRRKSQ